jgi:hypothetical protein
MAESWDASPRQLLTLLSPCSPAVSSRLLRKATAALNCLLLVLNHRHCWTTK